MSGRRGPVPWRADWDVHRAIVGILRRGGDLDALAREIVTAIKGRGWKEPGPTGLGVSRCRYHKGTALENGRCPIPSCRWSPHMSADQQTAMDEQIAAAAQADEDRLREQIADALHGRAEVLDRAALQLAAGDINRVVIETQADTYGNAANLIRQRTEKINNQEKS